MNIGVFTKVLQLKSEESLTYRQIANAYKTAIEEMLGITTRIYEGWYKLVIPLPDLDTGEVGEDVVGKPAIAITMGSSQNYDANIPSGYNGYGVCFGITSMNSTYLDIGTGAAAYTDRYDTGTGGMHQDRRYFGLGWDFFIKIDTSKYTSETPIYNIGIGQLQTEYNPNTMTCSCGWFALKMKHLVTKENHNVAFGYTNVGVGTNVTFTSDFDSYLQVIDDHTNGLNVPYIELKKLRLGMVESDFLYTHNAYWTPLTTYANLTDEFTNPNKTIWKDGVVSGDNHFLVYDGVTNSSVQQNYLKFLLKVS